MRYSYFVRVEAVLPNNSVFTKGVAVDIMVTSSMTAKDKLTAILKAVIEILSLKVEAKVDIVSITKI